MKILHMLQSDRFSGAENVACQIISMCKNTDLHFAYSSQDGQIREALDERGIEFHPLSGMSVPEFRRVIREVKPDVIHAHDMRAGFMAALTCGKIPLISHIHNNNFDSRRVSVKSLLYMTAAFKAKHIFWVSESSFEGYVFHKLFRKKSTVLYNIIDAEALENKMNTDKNSYSFDIIFLGRLTESKNPHRLIEIFEKVIKKRPDTRMVIVGTGNLDDEIKQLAADKGLSDNISFSGFQKNPYKLLKNSQVMLMTSRFEGTPMCALEAMALGVPIVSTPTDGLKDLITSGENGFLSDDDNILSEKILDILDNPQLHTRLSENQKNIFAELNEKTKYCNKILDAYKIN